MKKDPKELGWTRISLETFAEILNSFVEPISWKTMVDFFFSQFFLFVIQFYFITFAMIGLVSSFFNSVLTL